MPALMSFANYAIVPCDRGSAGNHDSRNLPDDVHRRVRLVAVQRGISAEAAARQLLDEATRPAEKVGDVITAFARSLQVDFPEVKRNDEVPEAAGKPIGLADAQIAAIARSHGFMGATRDTKPFVCAGVEVINQWD